MGNKITIIGAGSVGAAIAYTLAGMDIVTEIVLIDINKGKAAGEAMDIGQGTCFRDPVRITAGGYGDAGGSDIVIITSGVTRQPGQTRTELAPVNLGILKEIIPQIVSEAPEALYLMVSNPVDIMTYAFARLSGIPDNRVIGTGTLLDTARLRHNLSQHFGISQKNIHAYVLGGHGELSFIPWSQIRISGVELEGYCRVMSGRAEMPNTDAVLDYVRNSGARIIEGKGATFYGIAAAVGHMCRWLLSDEETVVTVSTMLHGEYGLGDVCLSIPAMVGRRGVRGRIPLQMQPEEIGLLRQCAESLKKTIQKLKI